MVSRSKPTAQVITAFVRRPEKLEPGKARCPACSRVISVTKNGHLRAHKTPGREDCAQRVIRGWTPHEPVTAPPAPIVPERGGRRDGMPPAPVDVYALDAGVAPRTGYCVEDGCSKFIGPDRTLCGQHAAQREIDRRGRT